MFVELSRNYNLIVIGNRGKGRGLAERLLGTTSSSAAGICFTARLWWCRTPMMTVT